MKTNQMLRTLGISKALLRRNNACEPLRLGSLPLSISGVQLASVAVGAVAMWAGFSAGAIATPQAGTVSPQLVAQAAPSPTSQESVQEIDSSVTRQYRPAVIYIPDPNTQELVPQSMLVGADEPAEVAVDQIIQSYEGQDVGIQSYEVSVDSRTREAEINFEVDNPRGGRAFQSLSSANQYSLFEAIRETLLTEPVYNVEEVIFMANDISFDI